jgi:hypothetical protein
MKRRNALAAGIFAAFFLIGCASPGPVVPTPPCVRVTQFDSILITPELVKFQAKVVIDNRMGAGLSIEKVVYGADLHDNPIFSDTFTDLHPMTPHGQQTVTFPFQIAMKDIMNQAVDVLAEEALRVSFRGEVFPVGFDAVPFEATRTIPLPRIPLISLEGAEGSPLEGVFTVFLRMKNTNRFPVCLKSVDSYLEMNGKKYGLLQSQKATEIGPGGSGRFALTLQHTTGKTLSMVLNAAQSRSLRFGVGGSISCQTPYGLIHVPVELSSEAGAR